MAEKRDTAPQETRTVNFKLYLDGVPINIPYRNKNDLYESLKKKMDDLGIPLTSVYSTDYNQGLFQLKGVDAVALAAGNNRRPLFAHVQDAAGPNGDELPLWQRHRHGHRSRSRRSSSSRSSRSHENSPEPFPHRPGNHDHPRSHHHHSCRLLGPPPPPPPPPHHSCHPRGPPPPPPPPPHHSCHPRGPPPPPPPPPYFGCFCGSFGSPTMGFGCRPFPFHSCGFGHGHGHGYGNGQGCEHRYSHGTHCPALVPMHHFPAFGHCCRNHGPRCGGEGFHGF